MTVKQEWVISKVNCLLNYPDVLTINDVKEILQIGSTTFYKIVKEGKIAHFTLGKKIYIAKEWLLNYINENIQGKNIWA